MPTLRSRLIGIAALLCILGAFGFAEWSVDYHCRQTQDCRGYHRTETTSKNQGWDFSLWYPTNSIDLYTLFLAVFTFGLTVANAWQGVFIVRADRSARDAIELARREFVSAHPPKIIVRRVSLDEGSGFAAGGISRPWKIQYIIANTGLGRATIYEGNSTVAIFDKGLPAIPPFDGAGDIPGPIVLSSGESVPQVLYLSRDTEAGVAFQDGYADEEVGGNPPNCIYFFGYIQYRDDIGIKRRTAFCRVYNFRTKRFGIVDDSDYEYGD